MKIISGIWIKKVKIKSEILLLFLNVGYIGEAHQLRQNISMS
jgi:hypothetical protein